MSDDVGAVMGTTTTIKTLVDGTFRVSIDISPGDAKTAFGLFGTPGTPVALARITPEAATAEARKEFQPAPAKGGAVCRLAAMLCNDLDFRNFLSETMAWAKGYAEPVTSEIAANIIRETCRIESRAELDHNCEAEAIFHRDFRLPFLDWKERK